MDSIIPPTRSESMFNITENSNLMIFGLMNQDSSGVIEIIFSPSAPPRFPRSGHLRSRNSSWRENTESFLRLRKIRKFHGDIK